MFGTLAGNQTRRQQSRPRQIPCIRNLRRKGGPQKGPEQPGNADKIVGRTVRSEGAERSLGLHEKPRQPGSPNCERRGGSGEKERKGGGKGELA